MNFFYDDKQDFREDNDNGEIEIIEIIERFIENIYYDENIILDEDEIENMIQRKRSIEDMIQKEITFFGNRLLRFIYLVNPNFKYSTSTNEIEQYLYFIMLFIDKDVLPPNYNLLSSRLLYDSLYNVLLNICEKPGFHVVTNQQYYSYVSENNFKLNYVYNDHIEILTEIVYGNHIFIPSQIAYNIYPDLKPDVFARMLDDIYKKFETFERKLQINKNTGSRSTKLKDAKEALKKEERKAVKTRKVASNPNRPRPKQVTMKNYKPRYAWDQVPSSWALIDDESSHEELEKLFRGGRKSNRTTKKHNKINNKIKLTKRNKANHRRKIKIHPAISKQK